MKSPKLKLGLPLTIATTVYIFLSLFGSALYLALPPFLCSIGARIHAYTLILFALEEHLTLAAVLWSTLSHLFVLVVLVCGVMAMVTGKVRVYSLLVALEVLITSIFLIFQQTGEFSSTYGMAVNMAYCVWLFRHAVRRAPQIAPAVPAKQGKPAKKKRKAKKGK